MEQALTRADRFRILQAEQGRWVHNVLILAEAKAIGEHAGVDSTVLFETLAKGSADSFALRNHGIKAVLKNAFSAACIFCALRAQGSQLCKTARAERGHR